MLDDDSVPRVQAHGAAALVNFSEDCPKGILVPYLPTIISKLEQVLTSKFKEVCWRCLNCFVNGYTGMGIFS